MCAHSVLVSSENKIKTNEKAAARHVGEGNWCDSSLTYNCIFVVEGEAGAAGHERIVAIAERQRINVAEVPRVGRESLTRHANQLVSVDKDELRIECVVRLDHAAVPDGPARTGWEVGVGGSACAEESAFCRVRVHGHEIEFLDVKEPEEPSAVKRFLPEAIGEGRAARGGGSVSWCSTDVGKRADAL